jgi:ATP synthase proteolipid subunit
MTVADEMPLTAALCPSWATGIGYLGVAAAVVLSNWGSAVRNMLIFNGNCYFNYPNVCNEFLTFLMCLFNAITSNTIFHILTNFLFGFEIGYACMDHYLCWHLHYSEYNVQWGTWKSGVSLVHTGIRHPKSVMKNVIPIVMAGVIGIYGLIVGVILAQSISKPNQSRHNSYSIYTSMAHVRTI